MHIVVCCKQVPEIAHARLDPQHYTLLRAGKPATVNPFDYIALECALQVKDREKNTVITLVSMGLPSTVQMLTHLFAYGADRAILLTDPALAGSDTYATGAALAALVRTLACETPVDLVLCGARSVDGATAHIGPGLARHLGWPQVTACQTLETVDPAAATLTAVRRLAHGAELVATRLPAVVNMAESAPPIRYATLPGVIRAQRYTPEIWTTQMLEVAPDTLGAAGSQTRVVSMATPPPAAAGEVVHLEENGLETVVMQTVALLQARELV